MILKSILGRLCLGAFFVLLNSISAQAQLEFDGLTFLGLNTTDPAHQMDVEIVGTKAFTNIGAFGGLETYDISDPTNPTYAGATGIPSWRSRAYDNHLFVFGRDFGLDIYNVAFNTSLMGHLASNGSFWEGGALRGEKLYVAAHNAGLAKVDVASLNAPILEGYFELTSNACWNVESSGNFLYVANGRHGLTVVEVTSILSEVTTLDLPGLANDIVLDDDVAVLSLGPSGIATVDISDPYNPTLMDTHPSMGNAWGMGIADHKVIVGSWRVMELFDVSDPYNIDLIGWDNTRTWAMGADIEPSGEFYIIAAADWNGMVTYRKGNDPAPDIDVYPLRIDFGARSSSADSTVIVRNTGTHELVVTNVNVPNGITVEPSAFNVPPGDSSLVTVTTSAAQVYDYIEYQSNDPDEGSFRQYVYCNNNSFPQVGSIAPDFTLQGTDGNTYTLSQMRGDVIFLEFGGGW